MSWQMSIAARQLSCLAKSCQDSEDSVRMEMETWMRESPGFLAFSSTLSTGIYCSSTVHSCYKSSPASFQPLKHSSVGKYMVPIHTPATETYCYLKDLLYDNGSLYLGHLVPFSQRPLGSLRQCQWWWVLGV